MAMAVAVAVAVLLILVVVVVVTGARIGNRKRPPGPPKLPVLGNLHQLGSTLHHSLWKLSRKHGPIMFLQLGTLPTIVISSAEAARQVLRNHDQHCCSRAASTATRKLSYNRLDMVFSSYHNQWREIRKLLVLELFSANKARHFQGVREEEVSVLVKCIAQSAVCGSPVDLSKKMFALNASVIFKTAFGKAIDGSEIDSHKLQEMVEEAEAVMGCLYASDFFPLVGRVVDRLTGLQARLERCFRDLDDFYQYVIGDHLDPARNKPEQEDIVDVLLRIEEQQNQAPTHFTRDHTKSLIMNVFLAGVTSSAILIIWAMTEIARSPRIMKKVQKEVRERIGNKGKVSEEDVEGLEYLKLVVKESLRLHPPVPLLPSREVMSHFKINGYDIHPKTRLEVNVWAIGRDPEKWNDPEEFYPERFENSPVDYKGNHFELLPFGAGRRGCPAVDMGMAIVELTLANLLYSFNWKLPEGMKEEDMDMEESPGLTSPKKSPLQLVPISFSVCDLATVLSR